MATPVSSKTLTGKGEGEIGGKPLGSDHEGEHEPTGTQYVTAAGAAPLIGVNRSRAQKMLDQEPEKAARRLIPPPTPDAHLWATGSDRHVPLWLVGTIRVWTKQWKAARDGR